MPIAAAVVRDALMAAGVALLDVTTEGGRAAALDGAHDTTLPAAERAGVRLTIGGPAVAEHVRHFEGRGATAGAQK